MPIRPENRHLYAKNWKEISKFIRFERAQGKCEFCGIANYSIGHWVQGKFITSDEAWDAMNNNGIDLYESVPQEKRFVKVVLTVAHLDQDPTNNDYSNLKALCQRCHLKHDQKQHIKTARKTRDRKYGYQYLFGEIE